MDNYGVAKTGWGYCEGPLVDGNQVVVTPGGDKGLLVAFDKETGKELWRSKEARGKAPYSSIIVAEAGGVPQNNQAMDKSVLGADPKDGKRLWDYNDEINHKAPPTPLSHHSPILFTRRPQP